MRCLAGVDARWLQDAVVMRDAGDDVALWDPQGWLFHTLCSSTTTALDPCSSWPCVCACVG